MLNPATFRSLVSGQRRGPLATLARCGLGIAEVPYTCAVRIRNRRYDTKRNKSYRVDVPLISVGNLTLGGTGKTPTVEWLARYFVSQGVRVGIVSRGYGTSSAKPNDEALELAEKLPDVPHVQNPDRVAATKKAIRDFDCQVILLDDGFQHRRLARDLDLVLIDALEPFGFDHVFPRGTLREPVEGLSRATAVALTRAEMVDESERDRIRRRVCKLAPQAVWLEIAHRPTELLDADGTSKPIESLNGHRVAAFCGIGNPQGFLRTLSQCQWDVVAWKEFPDHHAYNEQDARNLDDWARDCGGDTLVCTRKDLVKLRDRPLDGISLCALTVQTEVLDGRDDFISLLQPLVARSMS